MEAVGPIDTLDNGNYLVMGGSILGGDQRILIINIDKNTGDSVWTKIITKIGMDVFGGMETSLARTPDGGFVLVGSQRKQGTQNSDATIFKLDANADTLWTASFNEFGRESFSSVYVDYAGNLICGGWTQDTVSLNSDMFLLKTDANGNEITRNTYGGFGTENLFTIDSAINGGYILGGYTFSFGMGSNDIYIVKTDTAGNVQWQQTIGDVGPDGGGGIKQLTDTSYLVLGGYEPSGYSEQQGYAAAIDTTGGIIWENWYGHSVGQADWFVDAVVLDDGNIVLAGASFDTISLFDPIGWLVKIDSIGNVIWDRTYKVRETDNYFRGIEETADGGFVMTGFVFPDGGGTTQDAWVVKVDSMGCDTAGCHLVGVDEFTNDELQLTIWPNPSNGVFMVEVQGTTYDVQRIKVVDVLGRDVKQMNVESGKLNVQVDLTGEPGGVYFVTVVTDVGEYSAKVVVE